MDNVTSLTDAPLTRRQAREIERRTGIRPVAGAPVKVEGESFRHDTGEIKRNDVTALVSVLPTELVSVVSEVKTPEVADEPTVAVETVAAEAVAAEGRSLTVRAAVPAALVAQRRRRAVGSFAAAASVAAAATIGMGSLANADSQADEKHLASLAAAVNKDAVEQLPALEEAHEVAAAAVAPIKIDASNTSVTEISADRIAAATATAETVAEEASESVGSEESSAASQVSAPVSVPAGSSNGAALAAAAYNQVGITQDCTDAVQNALAEIGLTTRRDQGGYDYGIEGFASFGYAVDPSEAQPGDIMISYGYHVAIYLGDGVAMHGGWNGAADDTVITTDMGSPYDFDLIIRVN